MNYWWVNHKQTFQQEFGGGYIWSPKTNINGSRNHSYDNLTLVQKSDIIFSYADALIKAIGIVYRPSIEQNRPPEFGALAYQWGNDGWLVGVDWTRLERPFSPKENIQVIAPLLPDKYSPIQQNGTGNQVTYLANISPELADLLLNLSGIKNQILQDLTINQVNQEDDDEVREIENQPIPNTEKEQLVKSRIGQGIFRSRVEAIESGCRITGITDRRFLIASHIKPWRDSSNAERLDGNNGLLLSPHVDKLFDNGWISFSAAGDILFTDQSIIDLVVAWGIDPNIKVGVLNISQRKYLEYHRANVFKVIT